jgi:protein-export membrane protein SecD
LVKKLNERDGKKRVTASHILICYKGTELCGSSLSKEDAKAKAESLKTQATKDNFAELAKANSTEPGASESAGDLGAFTEGQMVAEFEKAAFAAKAGEIVGPVETKFGYHLIYVKAVETPKEYEVARVFIKTKKATDIVPPSDQWKFTGLTGKQLKKAEVTQDSRNGQVQVSLQFNDDGAKLFGDITTKNNGKLVAIFLDGEAISIPRVNEPILDGNAVISGDFKWDEAKLLAQRLNSGALPVPVELVSQQKVDATLGSDSLKMSFKAGVIGLIIVILFIIIYYRLPGAVSSLALLVYTALVLAIFKLIGFTLTLSGIAGFILSIGMAVDANVLVFERLKEELRYGKNLRSATEEAFLRAWSSIRDSNVTTMISCVFLIWMGTGFVKGFAVILFLGVIASMFTAITITRTLMRYFFYWFGDTANWMFLGHKKVEPPQTDNSTNSKQQ